MKPSSFKLLMSLAALFLLGSTMAAVSQRQTPTVTRVPICVKSNGQLRMLTDANTTCEPSERQVDWVVGGEVTDINLGQGLVGSREDGSVRLALDPSIIEGCTGCRGGRVFAGFNDGPGQIPPLLEGPIAELNLPAGDYVIMAKMNVETGFADFSTQRPVTSKLTAGTDFDEAKVVLEEIHDESPGHPGGSNAMGLTLQVVHSFSAPGSVVLTAGHGGPLATTSQVVYRDLKIIAIEVSHISNVFLGN
ncbi:MAG TPA: hypothetical protein VGV87_10130 [Blastocatellia bacterium]|jgi:hypothetical protein|nr:hypothetical protein [Blastocatellia bacterium]